MGNIESKSKGKKANEYMNQTSAFFIDACTGLSNIISESANNIQPSFSERSDDEDEYEDDESLYTKDDESQFTKDDSTVDNSLMNAKSRMKSHMAKGKSNSSRHRDASYDDMSQSQQGVKRDDSYSVGSDLNFGRNKPSTHHGASPAVKPLASSFAKRCHFTKAGIGKTTPHYEGLTLNGNVVLMLANAMKLQGCPTICDEDLRRVEQTYPNQFSRLPDELLLSSGWRRISKYCSFSNKPIPDGVPFFHSREKYQGKYFYLLASAIGMNRPIDVEPLSRDTLVLLETDFPSQCDLVPNHLLQNPAEWILVNKFCFFSGGPIHAETDVYYEATLDGSTVCMLAFLSPALSPRELYRLDVSMGDQLQSEAAVNEVESVYKLTERDFDDLKLYHLGPSRALPPYMLKSSQWRLVLPPPFLTCRNEALSRILGGNEPTPSFNMGGSNGYYQASSYRGPPSNFGNSQASFGQTQIDMRQDGNEPQTRQQQVPFVHPPTVNNQPQTPQRMLNNFSPQPKPTPGKESLLPMDERDYYSTSGVQQAPIITEFRPQENDDLEHAVSSSEVTSLVSGSSIWTDTNLNDRSSRRAIILQMAKARMKNAAAKEAENKANVSVDMDYSGDLD